jgi:hypothetical protein
MVRSNQKPFCPNKFRTPATIRIDKFEAAKTEWDETEIPVNWLAALFVRTELVASARLQTKAHPLIWRQDLQPPFRSKQEVIINAPLEAVWSFSMDLTKIPEFHPRVVKVDLLSGKTLREPGASYQCHLSGGKHTCIEKDIEIIPLQKIVTVLPEDTFGISKILSDYRVETTFQTLGHRSTKVEISHYYSTTTLKAKLLNLIAKGKIARETQATLNAAKATIEAACRAG